MFLGSLVYSLSLLPTRIPSFSNFFPKSSRKIGLLSALEVKEIAESNYQTTGNSFDNLKKKEIKVDNGEELYGVLKAFGCPFHHYGHNATLKKLLFGNTKKTKNDTVSTMSEYLSSQNRTFEDSTSAKFRKLLLKWIQKEELIIDDKLLRLPMFKPCVGSQLITYHKVHQSQNQVVIPPDLWYEECKKYFPDITIDTKNKSNAMLLKKLGLLAPDLKRFYCDTLHTKLEIMTRDEVIKFLISIAQMKDSQSPWSGSVKSNRDNQTILELLATKKLIIFDDGHRTKIADILDPTDDILYAILHQDNPSASEKNLKYIFPPVAYKIPELSKIFNKVTLQTLHDAPIFLSTARAVAETKNLKHGAMLIDFLVKNGNTLNWKSNEVSALNVVEFIPCFDVKNTSFSAVLEEFGNFHSNYVPNTLGSFSSSCFFSDLYSGWTQLLILSPSVSDIYPKFLNRFSIRSPVPTPILLTHLVTVVVCIFPSLLFPSFSSPSFFPFSFLLSLLSLLSLSLLSLFPFSFPPFPLSLPLTSFCLSSASLPYSFPCCYLFLSSQLKEVPSFLLSFVSSISHTFLCSLLHFHDSRFSFFHLLLYSV